MNINRSRPPKDGDVALWLSGIVNDALRDATEAGMLGQEVFDIVFDLARTYLPRWDRRLSITASAKLGLPLDGRAAKALVEELERVEKERDLYREEQTEDDSPSRCYCGEANWATIIACKSCGRVWGRCDGDETSAPDDVPNPMAGNDKHFMGLFVRQLHARIYPRDKDLAGDIVNAYVDATFERDTINKDTSLVDTFSDELGCTVRTCSGCGCLVSGGPTRCGRCAKG